ncbi:MAG: DUF3789 domain-containing protein [Blautia coccoides]
MHDRFYRCIILVGSMFGILLMCLVQINRLHGDPNLATFG